MHYSPEIAAEGVVETPAPRPTVQDTYQSGRAVIERAGATPLNSESLGVAMPLPYGPCSAPSDKDCTLNSPRDRLTVAALSLIVLSCAFGVAVAEAVFR